MNLIKIGLYNLEPNIVNTALMQVSTYHKNKGDTIKMYNPLFHDSYDKVYAFSIFDFTDKSYVKKDMIAGGTGFNITKKLPPKIEKCDYDWSCYPNCDYSMVWFSKGCIRNCKWCVVRRKEGNIKAVKPKNLNPNGKYIKVMDNNFFANPKWREAIKKLQEWNQQVDFQGIDARLLNKKQCEALNYLKHHKQIHIAWDNPKEDMKPHFKKLFKYIRPYRLMCYVLIGYWSTPEEDMMRIEYLRSIKVDPFVMPFDKKDEYQKNFARYVNNKPIFKSIPWKDYDPSATFKIWNEKNKHLPKLNQTKIRSFQEKDC